MVAILAGTPFTITDITNDLYGWRQNDKLWATATRSSKLNNLPQIAVDKFEVKCMATNKCPLVERQFTVQCIQHRPADQDRALGHRSRTTTQV